MLLFVYCIDVWSSLGLSRRKTVCAEYTIVFRVIRVYSISTLFNKVYIADDVLSVSIDKTNYGSFCLGDIGMVEMRDISSSKSYF